MRIVARGATLLLAAGRLAAQDTTSAVCAGRRIGSIVIHTSAPTVALLRKIPILAQMATAVHTTTQPNIIRRFLLLREGDWCDELRRAESERILRAQPFIAEATVRAVPNSDGGVDLDVVTTDEIALVLDGAAHAGHPPVRLLRLGDANVGGEGIYMAGEWRNGTPFRNGFGGKFVDNQLLGRPYAFRAEGNQNPLGDDWTADATHPFYTDIQRLAWLARAGGSDDYVQFMNDANSSHALRLTRRFFDVGGVVRIGPPGRLSLFGASVSGDDERPGTVPVLVTNKGFAPDTNPALRDRYVEHRIARINALWGVRDIGFTQVRGFDALTATQDLPIGFQFGTLFGRSLSVIGSRDDDMFMAGDLYIGAVGRNNALRVQLEGEGRRNNNDQRWDGLLANGHALEYFKFARTNTTTLSAEFSGGWHQRIPFNLTLSDPEGGVRGFASSNTPGGQRFVARLEDRQLVGRPFQLGDLGVGAFVDAGQLFAGDIPYGVTTPVRMSFGVSLLAAIPSNSARLWRLDVAFPKNPESRGHHFEIRLGNTNKTSFFLAEPSDVAATRERTVPSSVFRWPQ
ncbi:MAG TPA: hypothetical protein VF785_24835 [Gemmatimonadaceae bacterium]